MIPKLRILLASILLVAVIAYIGVPMFFKNRISGDLIDAAYVPASSGGGMICVLTDGSFSYFSKKKRAGREESGQKGIFCKTYLYGYDPVSQNVLYKKTVKYDQLPPDAALILMQNMLWQISTDPTGETNHVYGIDPSSGENRFGTEKFISQFPQLSAGIAKQSLTPYPPYIASISTKDGQNVVVDVADGQIADDVQKLMATRQKSTAKISVLALGDPEGGPRRRLWQMTGTNGRLFHLDISDSYFRDPGYFERNYQAKAELLPTTEVFLEGLIVYQDGDMAVVLHQDVIGENANRQLTCVDTAGKMKWRLAQADLFPALALKQSDPFSKTFFIRDRLRIKKAGNVLLIVFKPTGWIGVNPETGAMLWKKTL